MADHEKINIEGTFDGTIKFFKFDMIGQKNTPTIKVVCIDGDTDRYALGDIWCSEKALPKTLELLRALGVSGDSDKDVLRNAKTELDGKEITFDTEERGEYMDAKNIRVRGGAVQLVSGVEDDAFLAAVFGGAMPAVAEAPKASSDESSLPF